MKKLLHISSKIFLVLIALLLVSAWAIWFLDTQAMLNQYQVATESVTGINALKTSMGGAALIIGLFIILYFLKGNRWLLPIILSTGVLLIIRTISMFVDGSSTTIWLGIILEFLLILAALVLMNQKRSNSKR